MLSQNEKHLKELRAKKTELADEAKSILDKCREEGRERSEDENAEVTQIHATLQTLSADEEILEKQIEVDKDILKSVGAQGEEIEEIKNYPQPKREASIGEQFVESEQFKKAFTDYQNGAQSFSTGGIEIKSGTVLEGGQGAGLIPVPQVIPGQVETLFQRLTVADLLPSGQTGTNSIRYVVEGTATNSANAVAEGGAKPASDLALSTVDEPVKKIATILTVSDEMLEDVAQVQSYINGRLSLFVKIKEENSLVSGGGTDDLVGILGRSGIHTYPAGTVDNNAVALFKAINGTRGSSFLEPDAIIMNPANWQNTRLLTDTAGQFFGGGPFQGPYGNGSNLPASGQVTGSLDSIWGKPVLVTTAVGAGTALIGSFAQAAQLFRRGGPTVEATNSHASNFTSNLVTIRAEERLGLAVYRPGAFTKVTGLNS